MNNIKIRELFKNNLYKSIPSFIIIYLIYNKYKINKLLLKKPMKKLNYDKDNINFKYSCILLSNGYTHYRSNIIGDIKLSDEIFVFINDFYTHEYDYYEIIESINNTNKKNTKDYLPTQHNNYSDNHNKNKKQYYISYDIYGTGYSKFDNTDMNIQLYVNQLNELLHSLNVNYKHKLNLIGHKSGACISAGFAYIYPNRVKTLTLLSPIGTKIQYTNTYGLMYRNLIQYTFFRRIYSIYRTCLYYRGEKKLVEDWIDYTSRKYYDWISHYDKYNETYFNDNVGSLISYNDNYIKNFPISDMDDIYAEINKTIPNILAIYSEIDKKNDENFILKSILFNAKWHIYTIYKNAYIIENSYDIYNTINEFVNNTNTKTN